MTAYGNIVEMSVKIKVRALTFHYGKRCVLDGVNVDIPAHCITSISGPSGQGKSSFLTVLNRLWENLDTAAAQGQVTMDLGRGHEDIYAREISLPELRQKVGMVFQIPNPLPMSIFRNIAFPLKLAGEKEREAVRRKVEQALKDAFLWEEVKDRLGDDARLLSGGQQQRLCIARALVLSPQILLLDEPTSSLDETSVAVIEDLLVALKQRCTIIMVSHYADQVRRIADVQFVLSGRQLTRVPGEEQLG